MAKDSKKNEPYPKPGAMGGVLIRKAISLLKAAKFSSLTGSHILCAVSGGADSVALAHLVQKYGRKISPRSRLRLLHVNHGWRGEASDADARFVGDLGKEWGIPVDILDRRQLPTLPGASWEDVARGVRKKAFAEMLLRYPGVVFTAHHADDLAETWLWRTLTGNAETQGAAIEVRSKNEVRPLLQVRRHHLKEYLLEEGLAWREDSTNSEGRFLRSRMRSKVMPELDELFPRGVDHLVRLALKEQEVFIQQGVSQAQGLEALGHLALLRIAGVRARRSHWEAIEAKALAEDWSGELLLPGGWRIRKMPVKDENQSERWILEKDRVE